MENQEDFQKIKSSIVKCLTQYITCDLEKCNSKLDLFKISQDLIFQIATLALPTIQVTFETSTNELNNLTCQNQFKGWLAEVDAAIDKQICGERADIQVLIAQNKLAESKVKPLQKFESSQNIMGTVESLNKEIEQLENKIKKGNQKKVGLMSQIEILVRKTIKSIRDDHEFNPILVRRLTDHYGKVFGTQNYQFPPEDQLSYDNFLVAILDGQDRPQFNFIFSNGSKTQNQASMLLFEQKIPEGAKIHRICLWHISGESNLLGIEFFDKNEQRIVGTEWNCKKSNFVAHEFELEEGERIIGFKANLTQAHVALYSDFQFIIGKLK